MEIAAALDAEPIAWTALAETLPSVDLVIAATSAPTAVLDLPMVQAAMQNRHRPLFLLDIAMPRNIAADVAQLADVYLYDIDDLRVIADEGIAHRQAELSDAEAIVEAAVTALHREGELQRRIVPTIGQLHRKCDAIRREELERTLARLPGLPPEVRAAMTACTEAIVSRLLHDPILQVKTEQPVAEESPAATWLRRLFRLDETAS